MSHKVTSKMFHVCNLDETESPCRIMVLHKTGTLGPSGRPGSIPGVGVGGNFVAEGSALCVRGVGRFVPDGRHRRCRW